MYNVSIYTGKLYTWTILDEILFIKSLKTNIYFGWGMLFGFEKIFLARLIGWIFGKVLLHLKSAEVFVE